MTAVRLIGWALVVVGVVLIEAGVEAYERHWLDRDGIACRPALFWAGVVVLGAAGLAALPWALMAGGR